MRATAETIAAVIAGLKSEDDGIRRSAVRSLRSLALDAEASLLLLLVMLRDAALWEYFIALRVCEPIEVTAAAALAAALDERGEAAPGVAEDALAALKRALHDDRKDGTQGIAKLVLTLTGEPAVPVLIEALRDPDANARAIAVRALNGMGARARGAADALNAALTDPDEWVRYFVADTLQRIEREGAPTLVSAPKVTNVRAAGGIATATASAPTSDQEAEIAALIVALRDPSSRVRRSAAEELYFLAPASRQAIPALIEALEDEDVRLRAAEALRFMGLEVWEAIPSRWVVYVSKAFVDRTMS